MGWTRLGLMTLGACLFVGIAVGQVSTPSAAAFDVASVRENRTGDFGMSNRIEGNRYRIVNQPLTAIIRYAYQVQDVLEAPRWATSDTFDVEAVSERLLTDRALVFPMLQALLVERFGLVVRRESRNTPGYALVRPTKPDWMGPEIERSSTTTCDTPPTPSAPAIRSEVRCGLVMGTSGVTAIAVPITALLPIVRTELGARVIDRTGVAQDDRFDFRLRFTSLNASNGLPPGDWPIVSIALEEQLGLSVVRQAIPIDVVVVERVERPTSN